VPGVPSQSGLRMLFGRILRESIQWNWVQFWETDLSSSRRCWPRNGDFMPQIPVMIPLIVVGLVVGSILKSKSSKISKKKLASASLVAGLLNSVYAYLLYSLVPTQTTIRTTGLPSGTPLVGGFGSASLEAFLGASFLAAFLIVLLVLGIAMAYVRIRRGEEVEEVPEQDSEEEPTLTPS